MGGTAVSPERHGQHCQLPLAAMPGTGRHCSAELPRTAVAVWAASRKSFTSWWRGFSSEEKIKIKQIMSPIIAEERAVLRVSYIVVNLQRVVMVRQVAHHERNANCMMRAYIEIFGGSYVCGEIARVAWLVGGKRNIVLEDVHRLPGKSGA